jgi:hypothetical protein
MLVALVAIGGRMSFAQQTTNQSGSGAYGGTNNVAIVAQAQPLAVYEVPRPNMVHVVHVQYVGGIVGIFFNRAEKFSSTCQTFLSQGYRLAHVLPPRPSLIQLIAQLLLLSFTCCIFTIETGEMLVFERPM